MPSRSPQDLDRLLAGGKPAGPELDSMWQSVQQRLAEQAPAAVAQGGWSRRWRWLLALGAPAMAASALAFLLFTGPDPKPELQARGPADATPAIEASCGASEHPCAVGQPVFLRLVAGDQAGTLVLLLEGEAAPRVLGSASLQAGEAAVVPVQLVPEASDVEPGIALRLWFAPDGAASTEGSAQAALARIQASAQAISVVRRLQVSAP